MANVNIQSSTREFWLRTVKREVFLRIPLFAKLWDRNQVTWPGGTEIKGTVDIAETDDIVQEYDFKDRLESHEKTVLGTLKFGWKNIQHPVKYGLEELIKNSGGPGTAPVDLKRILVKKAHRGMRLKLNSMAQHSASATSAADKGFQSVPDALRHNIDYGDVTRNHGTTSANDWAQGASIASIFDATNAYHADNDQTKARTASISTVRQMRDAIDQNSDVETDEDLLVTCGAIIFNKLKAQAEARVNYKVGKGSLLKYGFDTFTVDGIEVVKDNFLNSNKWGTGGSPDQTNLWLNMLNLADWELRFHPSRKMRFTGFTHQAEQDGGRDEWLARIFATGNLMCWKPNGSIWLSNVS